MPVPIPDSAPSSGPRGFRIRTGVGGPNQDRKHFESETEAWGGWFASRSLQAQMLQGVKLNRGGIAFTAGENPSIVSSLSTPLKTLYLKDDTGMLWMAENVSTGVRTVLKKTDTKSFASWQKRQLLDVASSFLKERVNTCQQPSSWVFAEVGEPTKLATPTLNSIAWQHDRAFVIGPYTVSEEPTQPSSN
jgi:hypothetical protein